MMVFFFISFLQNAEEPSGGGGGDKKFVACVPSTSPRGHTGYLTTATYLTGNAQPPSQEPEKDDEDASEN